ncbi:hypothetical protein [Streptomyces millisiae]|uniref:DUF4237 domain-containing protein n=1 Tax=Streptomyces millisiae TaxID=3075542 RepID=A0ABU2LLJ6_9ACTN|nr:hypothetical protein [Streptomyces sp. DSM 44918]MDT0318460.1 hypothetical protein [Streptomyces sp. DSM 44918]
MSRLDTIRAYLIERFFEILTSDPDFAGLTEPAELFDQDGRFDVPATPAGFVRIPTTTALDARADASTDPEQREQLERFRSVLERTLAELFGLLGYDDRDTADVFTAVAERCAPVLRHPDSQTYWPVDIARYLAFDDGVLRGRLYGDAGARPIGRNAFDVLFDNPEAWQGPAPEDVPEGGRRPFAATIGIDAGVAPYPDSPLTAGHLNLPAGDARLTPGRLVPTLFTEVKSPEAASRLNRHYAATAARGGRFVELRNNRVHLDPLREVRFPRNGGEPLMFLYHAFYPADDGARRLAVGDGTNREFHHLAVGLLMDRFPGGGGEGEGPAVRRCRADEPLSGLLFLSTSPTTASVIPLDHPAVTLVDDEGAESPEGRHPVVFANLLAVQGLQNQVSYDTVQEGGPGLAGIPPTDSEFWAGIGAALPVFAVGGAGIGAVIGGPVGAGIGAVVAVVVVIVVRLLAWLVAWLLNKIFGGVKDRQSNYTDIDGYYGDKKPLESFRNPAQQDIGPPGVVSETGGETPGRSYTLRHVPHFPAENLYGLDFSTGDTFRIVDDAARNEKLAWRAFTGGVGYQFQRPVPGRTDVSGASLRDYFELFSAKYEELRAAREQVVYFGE